MLARSERLQRQIVDEIYSRGGWIPFDHYLKRALYDPESGYYSNLSGLGEQGDFVTAPEISPLFSRVIARQLAPVLDGIASPQILELGAGTGVMAVEMMLELERIGSLPEHYLILELSRGLRARQQQTFEQRAPHLLQQVQWLDVLPENGFSGAIVANEVMDAIPFERFLVRDREAVALGISVNPHGELIWSEAHQPSAMALPVDVGSLGEGYRSELRPALQPWIATLSDLLQQGMVLLLDYGYERNDYYRPERLNGTLSCYYHHRHHEDPLLYPGLQDITAHVDFTTVAEAASGAGLSVAGFTTQAYFLLAGGITQLAEQESLDDLAARTNLSRAIQQLTMPAQMGEVVKVMALTREAELPHTFTLHDMRHQL